MRHAVVARRAAAGDGARAAGGRRGGRSGRGCARRRRRAPPLCSRRGWRAAGTTTRAPSGCGPTANSPVCTGSVTPPGSGNTQTFGARIYRAPPYTTSRVPFTPSPNPAAAPAAAAAAPDTAGVAVGSVGIVIAVIAVSAMGLMYWRMTSQISAMTATSRPGVVDWATKSGQWTSASAAPPPQGSLNPATFPPGTVHL
jgi:hypothetical protein